MVVKLEIDISDDLERQLQQRADAEFDGDLNLTINHAIERWVEEHGNVEP